MKILLPIFIAIFTVQVWAADYYVRADGNDSNDGLSDTSGGAWLTLEKADTSVSAGDTVHVRTSTGSFAGTNLDASGSSGNYITYRGDGTNYSAFSSQIDLNGSYVVMEQFEFDYQGASGNQNPASVSQLRVYGDNCIVRSNYFHLGSYTMVYSGNYGVVHNNLFSNWDQWDFDLPAFITGGNTIQLLFATNTFDGNNGHDCIRPFGRTNTFTGNVFRNLLNGGEVGHGDHADILQLFTTSTDSDAQHIIFERNRIEDNNGQIGNFERFDTAGTPGTDWSTNMFDIHIRFNVFTDFRPQINAYIQNIYVYNNSMVNSSNWTTGVRFRYDSSKGSGDNGVYRNNIHLRGEGVSESPDGIALTSTTGGGSVTNITESHNLISETDDTAFTSGSFFVDASDINNGDIPSDVWVDFENENWTLKASSPAVNAGTNLTSFAPISFHESTLYDFDGNAMPTTGAWDIGAVQVHSVGAASVGSGRRNPSRGRGAGVSGVGF